MKDGNQMTGASRFWMDWIAIRFAVVGMALMALTITWEIGPIENQHVPRFFFKNEFGGLVFWTLYITCMPAYFLTAYLMGFLGMNSDSMAVFNSLMIAIQGIGYFLIGKVASLFVRIHRLKR